MDRSLLLQEIKDIEKTKFKEMLSKMDIEYSAVIYLSMSPMICVNICKTKAEGPFNNREIALINHLYEILRVTTRKQMLQQKNRNILMSTNDLLNDMNIGRIILDEELNICDFNERMLELSSAIHTSRDISKIMDTLIQVIEEDQGFSFSQLKEKVIITYNDYLISVFPRPIIDNDNVVYYYNITIQLKRKTDNGIHPDIVKKYNVTRKEQQIAELMIEGYSNKEISNKLFISVNTVKVHFVNLFSKLNVNNRIAAINILKG